MNDSAYSAGYAAGHTNPLGGIVFVAIIVVFYIYVAYSLYVMAKKTNVTDPWMAWLPILNVYVMVKIAGKPGWWFFLLLIPLVNIVIAFVIYYNMALRLHKPGWLGLIVGFIPILIGFLAFGSSTPPAPTSGPPQAIS